MRFVQFIENNVWEGERWVSWLQKDGNEEALTELSHLLTTANLPEYQLNLNVVLTEEAVDTLVEYAEGHTKVVGVLNDSAWLSLGTAPPSGIVDVKMYKGGIQNFFTEGE